VLERRTKQSQTDVVPLTILVALIGVQSSRGGLTAWSGSASQVLGNLVVLIAYL
jgi:hypothetical protein